MAEGALWDLREVTLDMADLASSVASSIPSRVLRRERLETCDLPEAEGALLDVT
jgi:hypothetical protein